MVPYCFINNNPIIPSTLTWYTNQTSATTTNSTMWHPMNLGTGATAPIVFSNWVWEDNTVTPQEYFDLARHRVFICRERTEAETRRLAEEERQREARARIAAEQHRLAGERARELLIAHLTAEQRKTMEEHNWFVIKGGKSGTRYRIRTGSYAGNIDILRGDKVAGVLCCHCNGIPLHDHHLAQKLTLQYDEDRFLQLANRQ